MRGDDQPGQPPGDPLPPQGAGRPDPAAFGRGLGPGLGVNLLVADVERAADKPHGVREAHLLDPEGYCWVPTVSRPG